MPDMTVATGVVVTWTKDPNGRIVHEGSTAPIHITVDFTTAPDERGAETAVKNRWFDDQLANTKPADIPKLQNQRDRSTVVVLAFKKAVQPASIRP
jgi:hypothetical protein